MANMLDYLDWRGDITLDRDKFNNVDNIILSWLSMYPLGGESCETISQVGERLLNSSAIPEARRPFLEKTCKSARFGGMKILNFEDMFDEQEQLQFAGYMCDTGDGNAFLGFRGTDNTLVGWKEDFNMSFMQSVPAQRESVRYLQRMAAKTSLPIRVGGHSKGGNLAVYASSMCSPGVQNRIVKVYNNDGPGLNEEAMSSLGYKAICPRVRTFLPQLSMVGILLYHTEDYRVVRSDGVGPGQHLPVTWQVLGRDFVFEGELREGSQYMDKTLKRWLETMSVDDRRVMIDSIYEVMSATNLKTMRELLDNKRASSVAMLNEVKKLPPENREVLKRVFSELLSTGAEQMINYTDDKPDKPQSELRQTAYHLIGSIMTMAANHVKDDK